MMDSLSFVSNAINVVHNLIPQKIELTVDPMLTVIKIAMLSFEPEKTKIVFSTNDFEIDRASLIQGVRRTVTFQNHDHIVHLKEPIIKAIYQYLPPNTAQLSTSTSSNSSSSTAAEATTETTTTTTTTTEKPASASSSKSTKSKPNISSSSSTTASEVKTETLTSPSNSSGSSSTKSQEPTKNTEHVRIIFDQAIAGLEKLKKTYEDNTAAGSCSEMINLLNGKVEITDPPVLGSRAQLVKETWKPHYLEEFATLFQRAAKIYAKNEKSTDDNNTFKITLEKISALIVVKQIEFKEILQNDTKV
jgi:DNA mismatch repair ATPase MutL